MRNDEVSATKRAFEVLQYSHVCTLLKWRGDSPGSLLPGLLVLIETIFRERKNGARHASGEHMPGMMTNCHEALQPATQ